MELKTCALMALVLAAAELCWCLVDQTDPVDAALARASCSAHGHRKVFH